MARDLKNLRQELEVEGRLKRLAQPDDNGRQQRTTMASVVGTSDLFTEYSTTTISGYLFSKINRYRGALALAVATMMIAVAAVIYFFNFRAGGVNEAINSVAVLPFVDANDNPNTKYVSYGLSDSLVNSLSQLPQLQVADRTSPFKHNAYLEVDAQQTAHSLGVDAIVTGSVTGRGNDLLISVELIDARNARKIWSQQYIRKESELLTVQAEIFSEVVQALRFNPVEQRQVVKPQTVNPKAYELLLKGRYDWNQGGTSFQLSAAGYFERATLVDPTYALAFAELALTYASLVNADVLDSKEILSKVQAAAYRAVELDEGLAEAHLAMARVKLNAWDWKVAEREIRRAIELSPNLDRAHQAFALYLIIRGQREQAIAEARRVRDLDPVSTDTHKLVAYLLFQDDEIIEAAKKMLELAPENADLHMVLGQLHTAKGYYGFTQIEAAQKMLELAPKNADVQMVVRELQTALGHYREAQAAFQLALRPGDRSSPDRQVYWAEAHAKYGEPEWARSVLKGLRMNRIQVSPVKLARLRLALGERDLAIALLERAYSTHDQQLIWVGVDSAFDAIRSDPRFEKLIKRMGLKS